jgi:hypothetical protein
MPGFDENDEEEDTDEDGEAEKVEETATDKKNVTVDEVD